MLFHPMFRVRRAAPLVHVWSGPGLRSGRQLLCWHDSLLTTLKHSPKHRHRQIRTGRPLPLRHCQRAVMEPLRYRSGMGRLWSRRPDGTRSAECEGGNCPSPGGARGNLRSLALLLPSSSVTRPVSRRRGPSGTPALRRCVSHVGVEILCVCSALVRASAFGLLPSAFAAHRLLTQYCCPVSQPESPRRGRHRRCAPAAIQAFCCSSVSDSL